LGKNELESLTDDFLKKHRANMQELDQLRISSNDAKAKD
jgi:hypothetical protein